MDGPAGRPLISCRMNISLVMLAYVPCQTSIPYNKNGLIILYYNAFTIANGKYLDHLNRIPTYLNIFRAITSTWFLNATCILKIIPKNLILFVFSIVVKPILMLVKCSSFSYENIIYFVLSALIQIRYDVSQLLTF